MTTGHRTREATDPARRDVRAAGDRVEELVAELGSLADERARARAEELVRVLVDLYGAGLERIVEIVTEAEAAPVLRGLVADDLVSALLVLHDLHPLDTAERVREAIDEVRPYLGLHDGGVELVEVTDEGVVRLCLEGACHGCPSSRLTVTRAIERAIARAAPEVIRVEVEGVAEGTGPVAGAPTPPLLRIEPHRPPGPCPAPEQVS